ncbi:MAG: putative drug exporter of the superfamily [Pseudonocardiales bacterium]|nr:putative drug exporter of the superfamily [Pseudonocardiales bacterium]
MEGAMDHLATTLLKHRRLVLLGWALLCVVGAIFAAGLPGRIVSGGEAPASSQSEVVARELADTPLPALFVAVRVPPDATPADQAHATSAVALAVHRVRGVTAVSPLPDVLPARLEGARVTVLNVSTSGGTDGAVKAAHALSASLPKAAPKGVEVHVGGFGAYRDELTVLSQRDLQRAERIGIPIVLVVLLVTFGSLWAAGLPLAIALSALLMGLGGVGVASFFLPMSDFVTNSASMIGLALGVDYAMFLLQRVRELTHSGRSVDDAVRVAMGTTGVAVLWSGMTVLFAEAALLLVDSRSIRSAAFGMVMVTLFAMATALFVAPVLISVLGRRIAPARLHAVESTTSRGWHRWARHVTRRAPIWLIAGAVLMLALALPSTKLHSSVNISGTSSLPGDSSVRQAYELAGQRYGSAAMSPVLVLLNSNERPKVARVVHAIAADAQVASAVPQTLPDGRTAVVVTAKADAYSAATRGLVERIRDGSVHAALAGVTYRVGGETAASMDATKAMFDGLPKVGLALLLVVGLLLLFALRSVFLPLKAVVLVILSLGASLGSLVLLATTKVGAHLIGASGPQDIHPIVPITIVAITVALSTDYEVILISRIAEHYKRTGNNRGAVVDGIAHTGSVITSAAAIMIAVFAGFALADLAPLKQLGVGLGLAVFIDATVVRGVLVPAAMAVMGRRNWWLPARRTVFYRRRPGTAVPEISVGVRDGRVAVRG